MVGDLALGEDERDLACEQGADDEPESPVDEPEEGGGEAHEGGGLGS